MALLTATLKVVDVPDKMIVTAEPEATQDLTPPTCYPADKT